MSEISDIVTKRWPLFQQMGWRSPSQTIQTYEANPERWEQDFAAIRATGTQRALTKVSDTQRKTAIAVDNIRRLWKLGRTVEEIQRMVPDHIDGSGWSETSIMKICQGSPTPVDAWMAAQSNEGGFDRLRRMGVDPDG